MSFCFTDFTSSKNSHSDSVSTDGKIVPLNVIRLHDTPWRGRFSVAGVLVLNMLAVVFFFNPPLDLGSLILAQLDFIHTHPLFFFFFLITVVIFS